jgi:lysophospholipase L1-like esterase
MWQNGWQMLYSIKKNSMLKVRLAFSLFFFTLIIYGQDTVRFSISDDRGLVDYTKNRITHHSGLDNFFEKLVTLKTKNQGQVNILHIGDSHIQADYQTNQLRQNFQREFGNGGRGFLIPARVAQSTEPNNYISQSNNKWEAKRIVFPDQPLPTGLGGVSIRSIEENATLSFSINDYPDLKYGATKLTAFLLQEPRSFHIAIRDSGKQDLAYIGNFSDSKVRHTATINLALTTNSISFRAFKTLPHQDRVTFFGFNFINSNPGIVYHAVGANGAKYKHFLASDFFIEQTPALNPDLIIIALGTNEALDHPYFDPEFPKYVDDLVQKIRKKNPMASLLIAIPPDSFKKKNKRNPGVVNIRKILMEYAEQNGIPCYDLYEAGGGNHSADNWRKVELLRDDGVHFTRQGYELQGNMFYSALMKAFNNYVSNRR